MNLTAERFVVFAMLLGGACGVGLGLLISRVFQATQEEIDQFWKEKK